MNSKTDSSDGPANLIRTRTVATARGLAVATVAAALSLFNVPIHAAAVTVSGSASIAESVTAASGGVQADGTRQLLQAGSGEETPPWMTSADNGASVLSSPSEFGVSEEDQAMAVLNLDIRRGDAPRYSRMIYYGDYAYHRPSGNHGESTEDYGRREWQRDRTSMIVENLSSRTAKVRFQNVCSSNASIGREYDIALPPGTSSNVLRFTLDWLTNPKCDRFIVHSDEPVYFSGHAYTDRSMDIIYWGAGISYAQSAASDRQLNAHAVDCGTEYQGNEWLCQIAVAQTPWNVHIDPP